VVGVDGAKMAKSTGNLVLVRDLLAKYPAAAVRMMILDRRWAVDWDYDPASLDRAADRVDRLAAAAGRPSRGPAETAQAAIAAALARDLDVPTALEIAEESGGAAAAGLASFLNLAPGPA
jgi:cysteinyl-tRNA synthetase